ncbi:MmcQ/YjbR family DNA-binding protein [Pimelobacter simplex]|uniref:MmcQ/YjbR family DNA-binding protein n=1 Tax=Nocardioides simplex TaxID=2045 RepID=UPI001933B042|nr:MmcQ/YjbR family DNA-binding protein [Pimelobacter simplex]
MAHPIMFSDDDPGLAELRAICLALPGAEERVSHGRPTFRAGRIFAAFGGSEKIRPGDHRMVPSAFIFTPDDVDLPAIDADPRFFVPAYYGPYGGRAIDLAVPGVDWTEIAELADASYRRVAPKRLIEELDARG